MLFVVLNVWDVVVLCLCSSRRLPHSAGLDVSRCTGAGPCTAMIKNIHCKSTQESIMRTLNELGFDGKYDTIYAPGNPARKTNLGYAFVNFCALEHVREFYRVCNGKAFDGAPASRPSGRLSIRREAFRRSWSRRFVRPCSSIVPSSPHPPWS